MTSAVPVPAGTRLTVSAGLPAARLAIIASSPKAAITPSAIPLRTRRRGRCSSVHSSMITPNAVGRRFVPTIRNGHESCASVVLLIFVRSHRCRSVGLQFRGQVRPPPGSTGRHRLAARTGGIGRVRCWQRRDDGRRRWSGQDDTARRNRDLRSPAQLLGLAGEGRGVRAQATLRDVAAPAATGRVVNRPARSPRQASPVRWPRRGSTVRRFGSAPLTP